MHQSTVFSIIVITFNRPTLLARALRSVLAQTFCNWECIVVDDAGDTDTAAILRQLNDARLRLIRHPTNKGASAAVNTGIEAAHGALISRLDDDDELSPLFLEKTYALFQASPEIGFAWAGIRCVRDTTTGAFPLYERVWPECIQPREAAVVAATTIGGGFGLTIRRGVTDVAGFFDETFRVGGDTEYYFRLVKHCSFKTVPHVLVTIHDHSHSRLTGSRYDMRRFELYASTLQRHSDFIASFPALFDIHYRRLAQMAFSLGLKWEGRRIVRALFNNGQGRGTLLRDLVFYETTGVDASTLWQRSRLWILTAKLKRLWQHRRPK